VPSRAVPGFQPSVHGFHFPNTWPSAPAFRLGFGLVRLGLGDAARGFCGGMSQGVRDRFERGELPPPDAVAPTEGTPLFAEMARRQLDSFDWLIRVPLRFWWGSVEGARARDKATVREAWPAIRADIDGARLAMIGLVRTTGFDPLRSGLGHQVVGYRYEETADRVTIAIYDPNHPGADGVTLLMARAADGSLALSQSTGEPLAGLLHLPYVPPR
jgi:hypothetical protein